MAGLQLTKKTEALIDDADVAAVNQFKWLLSHGYARRFFRENGILKSVYLHNFLMSPPKGLEVDHVNRNKLDNRRENLRLVTHAQNCRNKRPSQHRGVYPSYRALGRWTAETYVKGKKIHLGTFAKPELAMEARILAEAKYE